MVEGALKVQSSGFKVQSSRFRVDERVLVAALEHGNKQLCAGKFAGFGDRGKRAARQRSLPMAPFGTIMGSLTLNFEP